MRITIKSKAIDYKLLIGSFLLSVVPLASFAQNRSDNLTKSLREHVEVLASQDLEGRYPGTAGDRTASSYIADHWTDYGLTLFNSEGFQPFKVRTGVSQGVNNQLIINDVRAESGKDFIPMFVSGNGLAEGELVFAGYGFRIKDGDHRWDDFENIDVKDKIVLMLLGAPDPPADSDIDPFEDAGSLRVKILNARDQGAAAVLFVAGPRYDEKDVLEFEALRESPAGIPVLRVSRGYIGKVFAGLDMDIAALEADLAARGESLARTTNLKVSLQADVTTEWAETCNVIAWIPAVDTGLRHEWVVIGAHFDHLGMGGQGSNSRAQDTVAVHPGADDNASGVAGIIEIAGILTNQEMPLKRSVLFVAFGAEELGLLGSKYFVEEPPVDLNRISAMINLDMIGRLNEERRVNVSGTGTAVEMDSLLAAYSPHDFHYVTSPEGYGPSDHAAFYSAGIPVLYFSTGAHLDYHTPQDTPDKLDYNSMSLIISQIAELTNAIANHPSKLTFSEAGPRKADSGRRNLKVTLGIMPDVSGTSNDGLRVEFATPGKPAHQAGIRKGDRIVAMNGLSVQNIYEYMSRLQQLKAGQVVSVEVIRDERPLVFLVQL
ncbi:MAG: M20/M25/M40 family metallo-hydrolase [Bacteroidales bacterium]|nr:M20/M25/M40 family metallo-hydrolase [Bacteroidales bacterium]MDD4812540.1 M20/M25/M40 family metallo-hydrolase [Bacteroidales bacterium]